MLHHMPTLNPRITVTLTPACSTVLRELSQLAGNSQSAIVGELLESSMPVLERVVIAIRASKGIQQSAKDEILGGMERAQAKLEDQLGLALDTMDESFRPLLDHAEKVHRRGPKAGGAPARGEVPAGGLSAVVTPVPLTGGSGHLKRRKPRENTKLEQAMPSGGWQGVDESWEDYQTRLKAVPKGNKRGRL